MSDAPGTDRFALNSVLRDLGVVGDDEPDDEVDWTPLVGGYHNDVALVSTATARVVVKRFVAGSTNPLYPQLPADEFRALQALTGTGLAPEPIGFLADVDGRALLVYMFVPGEMWSAEAAPTGAVGAMLRRMHDRPTVDGFRDLPSDPHAVVAQSRAMVSGLDICDRLLDHLAIGADSGQSGSGSQTLVHTDCGPGNIVISGDGPCLIDWQCPGIGDPVEDLANFASPAIQILYHHPPLTTAQLADLLIGYGDSPATEAFADLRWSYHVRLAAYCAYRQEELVDGRSDIADLYGLALRAELDLLDSRW